MFCHKLTVSSRSSKIIIMICWYVFLSHLSWQMHSPFWFFFPVGNAFARSVFISSLLKSTFLSDDEFLWICWLAALNVAYICRDAAILSARRYMNHILIIQLCFFFFRLLQDNPHLKTLFSFMKVNGAPFDSPMFKSHVRNVFTVIGDAVNHIDDLDSLSPILKDLGVKHQGYGAKKEYLEVKSK